MAATVGEERDLAIAGTNGRRLHLSRLAGDADGATNVLCRGSLRRVSPEIELKLHAARDNRAVAMHARLEVRHIGDGQAARFASLERLLPQSKRRQIRHRCRAARAVDDTTTCAPSTASAIDSSPTRSRRLRHRRRRQAMRGCPWPSGTAASPSAMGRSSSAARRTRPFRLTPAVSRGCTRESWCAVARRVSKISAARTARSSEGSPSALRGS